MPSDYVGRERSLTEQVMEYVRDSTLNGELKTGEWYSVYQLSDRLGISRSPVRDALLRLEEAGLIQFTRNRGFQLVETHPEDIAEIFSLRLAIEPAAAYRAALQRTAEELEEADRILKAMATCVEENDEEMFFLHDRSLHELILRMGNSFRGAELVDRLRDHTRILGPSTAETSRPLQVILEEHEPVLSAIRRGSAEIAKASMREHLQTTGKLLLSQAIIRTQATLDTKSSSENAAATEKIWEEFASGV